MILCLMRQTSQSDDRNARISKSNAPKNHKISLLETAALRCALEYTQIVCLFAEGSASSAIDKLEQLHMCVLCLHKLN